MAVNLTGQVHVTGIYSDAAPVGSQPSQGVEIGRVHLLGADSKTAGAACVVTVAAATGMSNVITKIMLGANGALTGGTLTVVEDAGGTPHTILSVNLATTDTSREINWIPPLKGDLIDKTLTVTFTPGGTVNSTLNVYGWQEN